MSANQFWQGKNVFITGINGFVGGTLAKTLLNQGAYVTGLIRNGKKNTLLHYEGLVNHINVIEGDLTDLHLMKRILAEEMIDCVFHLAAQVEVGVARTYPYLTWETNVRGTYTVLEAVRENKERIQSVVIASSDKAYGSYPMSQMPYQEDYPLIPIFPYDVSKAAGDMIARSYASNLYSLPIVVTRFCNIYGPGQLNFSAVIPDSIQSALGYNTFVPRGTGAQIRDFIYTGDVANLYLRIGEALAKKPEMRGEVFNAGTNEPKKIRDVVERIFKMANRMDLYSDVEGLWKNEEAAGEIDCQYMDFKKVQKFFDWTPQTSFDNGLKETFTWFEKYLKDTRK